MVILQGKDSITPILQMRKLRYKNVKNLPSSTQIVAELSLSVRLFKKEEA